MFMRNKHVVVPLANTSVRCVYPGCANRSARPKFQCFRCKVPLCIASSEKELDSCWFLYHTVKKLKTAKEFGEGLIRSLPDDRISDDSEQDM